MKVLVKGRKPEASAEAAMKKAGDIKVSHLADPPPRAPYRARGGRKGRILPVPRPLLLGEKGEGRR